MHIYDVYQTGSVLLEAMKLPITVWDKLDHAFTVGMVRGADSTRYQDDVKNGYVEPSWYYFYKFLEAIPSSIDPWILNHFIIPLTYHPDPRIQSQAKEIIAHSSPSTACLNFWQWRSLRRQYASVCNYLLTEKRYRKIIENQQWIHDHGSWGDRCWCNREHVSRAVR